MKSIILTVMSWILGIFLIFAFIETNKSIIETNKNLQQISTDLQDLTHIQKQTAKLNCLKEYGLIDATICDFKTLSERREERALKEANAGGYDEIFKNMKISEDTHKEYVKIMEDIARTHPHLVNINNGGKK